MNKTILLRHAFGLMILWFVTGRQLGHVGAKYARRKRSSIILMIALILISLCATIFFMYYTID